MLTDRTRITTYQTCPRLRFLTFHLGGKGLVPVQSAYELRFGIVYHDAIERLHTAVITPDDPDPDARIIQAAVEALTFENDPTPFYQTEQRYLLAGLLWAWALTRRPQITAQYEVVKMEQEFLWDMGEGIQMMVRLDALLRDRFTSDLYYWERKTTAYGNEKWSDQFTHNAQVMAGILACEQALREKPVGVIIEGHVKGSRRVDTAQNSEVSGFEFQDSPLCYLWQLPDGSVSPKWQRGGRRVSAWSMGVSPKDWVAEVLTPYEREACFRTLPPILPDLVHLQRWQRQTIAQELRIRRALVEISDEQTDSLRVRDLLDDVFPLHEGSCEWQYGRRCSHHPFCHNQTVAQQPFAAPGYIPRVPHHPAETQESES